MSRSHDWAKDHARIPMAVRQCGKPAIAYPPASLRSGAPWRAFKLKLEQEKEPDWEQCFKNVEASSSSACTYGIRSGSSADCQTSAGALAWWIGRSPPVIQAASKPYCVSSGSMDGFRPRKAAKTSSGCCAPPRARIVWRNLAPTAATASSPPDLAASWKAPYASHERISAHL